MRREPTTNERKENILYPKINFFSQKWGNYLNRIGFKGEKID